jgi:hypothetical protein
MNQNRNSIIDSQMCQKMNQSDGKPYLVNLKSYSNGSSRFAPHPALEANTIGSEETGP